MGFIAPGAAVGLTLLFVLTADVAPISKILAVAMLASTFFIDRLILTGIPLGFILQVVLCLFYLAYFKFESA